MSINMIKSINMSLRRPNIDANIIINVMIISISICINMTNTIIIIGSSRSDSLAHSLTH